MVVNDIDILQKVKKQGLVEFKKIQKIKTA